MKKYLFYGDTLDSFRERPQKGHNTNSGNRGELKCRPICRRKRIIIHFNLKEHKTSKKKHKETFFLMLYANFLINTTIYNALSSIEVYLLLTSHWL